MRSVFGDKAALEVHRYRVFYRLTPAKETPIGHVDACELNLEQKMRDRWPTFFAGERLRAERVEATHG
jgi:hypothetical protein